jgi:hypothetical protein
VGYRTERSPAFLGWRYGSHPEIAYGVHPAFDGARLTGVVVARPVLGVAGLGALLITELFLREPTVAAGAQLLRSLIRSTSSDYLIAHFSSGTIERAALLRTGFIPVPRRGYTFVARLLNETREDPRLSASWDLTLGELEIF